MPKSTTTANDTLDALLRAVDPAWRSGAATPVSSAISGQLNFVWG